MKSFKDNIYNLYVYYKWIKVNLVWLEEAKTIDIICMLVLP